MQKSKLRVSLFVIAFLLLLLPIEYIAIVIDYNSNTVLGYIPYLLLIVLTLVYADNIKKLLVIAIIRLIGGLVSYVLICLSSNALLTTNYFKPLEVNGFSIMLSIISILVIILTYVFKKTWNR